MGAYGNNKLISLGLPVLFLLMVILSFGNTPDGWRFILMSTIVYGYTHFVVGAYFQVRGFALRSKPIREYTVFAVIVLLSILLACIFYYLGLMLFFGGALILYFIFHGYLNEQTLFVQETENSAVPRDLFAFIGLWIGSMTLFALSHQSAFFTQTFDFLSVHLVQFYRDVVFGQIFTGITILGWVLLVCSLVYVVRALFQKTYRWWVLFFLALALPGTYWSIVHGPAPYIYLYFFLLGYHFTTWIVFYARRFYRERSPQLPVFLFLHAAIILLFVGSLMPSLHLDSFSQFLFNFNIHITFSLFHITTSLMNETWFKKMLDSVWPV